MPKSSLAHILNSVLIMFTQTYYFNQINLMQIFPGLFLDMYKYSNLEDRYFRSLLKHIFYQKFSQSECHPGRRMRRVVLGPQRTQGNLSERSYYGGAYS